MALFDAQTSVKVTTAELERWRAAARVSGLPLQTWMRITLDHAAGIGQLADQLLAAAEQQKVDHAAAMRAVRDAAKKAATTTSKVRRKREQQ